MPGVLKILPTFHTGGVEQATLSIANYLAEKGIRSFVASSGGLLEKSLHPKVTHVTLPLNTKNPLKIINNAFKLKKIIKKHKIKIVHAGSRAPAWSAYLAAKITNTPFVTTYHGAYSQNILKWHYNKVMALGNPVVVASRYMAEHVENYYPGTKCVNIPSGINTGYFNCDQEIKNLSTQLRCKWNVPGNGKVILLVGRFTRIKGHEFLLKSLACFKTKKQPTLVFVGDGKNAKYIEELKSIANRFKINLFIHTEESDLRPFYDAADVVIVPTIKPEAFGRVTVEAMSMGKVVIGNDLGASAEIINTPDWIFDHSSTESLADKIDNALKLSIEQDHCIGQQNRERAVSCYDTKILVEEHMKIYDYLIKAEKH